LTPAERNAIIRLAESIERQQILKFNIKINLNEKQVVQSIVNEESRHKNEPDVTLSVSKAIAFFCCRLFLREGNEPIASLLAVISKTYYSTIYT